MWPLSACPNVMGALAAWLALNVSMMTPATMSGMMSRSERGGAARD